MDLLSDLTAAQREAVTCGDGPVLVLAGAGSGKTRVLTRRVAYLLAQGISPQRIVAITFTNKAAGEMRQRIEALVGRAPVWVGTFHALAARLLRQWGDAIGLERTFTIYDQDDRRHLIRRALETAGIDSVHYTPERVEAAISRAKNQLVSPEEYTAAAGDFFEQTIARVYPVYERQLRAANALDFDDLLYWLALMLRKRPDIRAELDDRFRYILVDEYQDTNYAQYSIVRRLSMDHPHLFVVGDPDQSIYRWRGADLRNILEFERDYPNARVIRLEHNFRSTPSILRAASHLIAHNYRRKQKQLVTSNPDGPPVRVLTFGDGEEEAQGIAAMIRDMVARGGRRYGDIALFVRVNALSRALESAFVRLQIPYEIVRGLAFFERKENRDILAYLRVIHNPRDDMSFVRALGTPPRGIGRVTLEHLRLYAEPRGLSLLEAAVHADRIETLRGKAARALKDFAALVTALRHQLDLPVGQLIAEVLDRSGYRHMLQSSNDPQDQERLANIEELITAAHRFVVETGQADLASFLEHIALASDIDTYSGASDRVPIMTLHAAKGLEFPVVFMVAMEQGLLPHERSLDDEEELEEERRLAFVGMTRAREELYLTHARWREFRGMPRFAMPSQFLQELPEEGVQRMCLASEDTVRATATDSAPQTELARKPVADRSARRSEAPDDRFAPGQPVLHQVYGRGLVLEVSGYGKMRKIKVRFAQGEDRTFVLDKAPLVPLVNLGKNSDQP